jgi:hypothetical protein
MIKDIKATDQVNPSKITEIWDSNGDGNVPSTFHRSPALQLLRRT